MKPTANDNKHLNPLIPMETQRKQANKSQPMRS